MKPNFLIPAVTATLGFTLAWVAKPGGGNIAPARPQNELPTPGKTSSTRLVNPSSARNDKRPQEVKASDFPLADAAELGPKTRDEARMLRLTEALGLSIDQQGDIIKLVEEAQAKVDGTVPVIQDLAQRGKILEDGLAKVLKPEQLAKFQQLRDRERENLLEHRSQKVLNQAIEDIDLSPDQREQVLVRLRQRTRAELQAVPAAATLLYGKSMLPTNNKELSVDGVLILAKINDDPLRGGDPTTLQKRVFDSHRRDLEQVLTCFDGILTAGQMGQYQAILAESQAIMNRMPDPMPDSTPSEPEPPGPGDRDEELDQETENP